MIPERKAFSLPCLNLRCSAPDAPCEGVPVLGLGKARVRIVHDNIVSEKAVLRIRGIAIEEG
jgi:hypothetical protein